MIDRYLNLVFLINLFKDKNIVCIFYKSSQNYWYVNYDDKYLGTDRVDSKDKETFRANPILDPSTSYELVQFRVDSLVLSTVLFGHHVHSLELNQIKVQPFTTEPSFFYAPLRTY